MSETINIKRKPYRNQGPSTHNSYNHQTPTLQTSMQVKRKSNNNTRHHTKPNGNHTEIKESQNKQVYTYKKPYRNQGQPDEHHTTIQSTNTDLVPYRHQWLSNETIHKHKNSYKHQTNPCRYHTTINRQSYRNQGQPNQNHIHIKQIHLYIIKQNQTTSYKHTGNHTHIKRISFRHQGNHAHSIQQYKITIHKPRTAKRNHTNAEENRTNIKRQTNEYHTTAYENHTHIKRNSNNYQQHPTNIIHNFKWTSYRTQAGITRIPYTHIGIHALMQEIMQKPRMSNETHTKPKRTSYKPSEHRTGIKGGQTNSILKTTQRISDRNQRKVKRQPYKHIGHIIKTNATHTDTNRKPNGNHINIFKAYSNQWKPNEIIRHITEHRTNIKRQKQQTIQKPRKVKRNSYNKTRTSHSNQG